MDDALAQARREGKSRYFTGKPCKNGHLSERTTSNNTCVECRNERRRGEGVRRDESAKRYAKHREKVLATHYRWKMKNTYGITPEEYDAMLQEQGGGCAICGSTSASVRSGKALRLCIDHCHKTGAVRRLLCTACNSGLGHFQDDIELVLRAAAYLKGAPLAAEVIASLMDVLDDRSAA